MANDQIDIGDHLVVVRRRRLRRPPGLAFRPSSALSPACPARLAQHRRHQAPAPLLPTAHSADAPTTIVIIIVIHRHHRLDYPDTNCRLSSSSSSSPGTGQLLIPIRAGCRAGAGSTRSSTGQSSSVGSANHPSSSGASPRAWPDHLIAIPSSPNQYNYPVSRPCTVPYLTTGSSATIAQ